MPDFQQGKIYKIEVDGLTYYGSTATTLKERMWKHKSNFKRWKDGVGSNRKSFQLFEKYGFENCPIELVENYPCATKKELLIREDWYIKNMACINEISAYTSREEALEKKRERVVCECSIVSSVQHIARHRKTTIHLAKLKSNHIVNVIPHQHRWNAAV